jgi:hypothetical protein
MSEDFAIIKQPGFWMAVLLALGLILASAVVIWYAQQ